MTFEHLEYFIAVVEENSFFDAADALNISQSSLSKQIIKLEQELGVKLLNRSKRKASLTEAGEEFYKEALALHRQYHRMLGNMNKYKSFLENEIYIGVLPILTQYQLTARFKAFSDTHSDIHIILEEAEEKELVKKLDGHIYNFIIAREQLVKLDKYQYYPLAEDELVAVLPASHPLAVEYCNTARPISLSELANENFILMHPYTSVYLHCMEEMQKHNININVVRTARVESIISAVSIGEGVSLIPESNLNVFYHDNIVSIPLTPSARISLVLARKKDTMTTAAMRTFIKCF